MGGEKKGGSEAAGHVTILRPASKRSGGPSSVGSRIVACPACDLLHRRDDTHGIGVARCSRCGTLLYRNTNMSSDRPLALAMVGMFLLLLANFYPFLTLDMEGRTQETLLVSGVLTIFHQGYPSLATLVLITGILCPFGYLGGMIYVLAALKFGRHNPHLARLYRWVRILEPWAMVEIFMLGVLVSMVKLTDDASVLPGLAFYAFMSLIFLLPAVTAGLDPERVWTRISGPPPA